jgi:hypothetical protein
MLQHLPVQLNFLRRRRRWWRYQFSGGGGAAGSTGAGGLAAGSALGTGASLFGGNGGVGVAEVLMEIMVLFMVVEVRVQLRTVPPTGSGLGCQWAGDHHLELPLH